MSDSTEIRRVLVVDDDEGVLTAVAWALERMGQSKPTSWARPAQV